MRVEPYLLDDLSQLVLSPALQPEANEEHSQLIVAESEGSHHASVQSIANRPGCPDQRIVAPVLEVVHQSLPADTAREATSSSFPVDSEARRSDSAINTGISALSL